MPLKPVFFPTPSGRNPYKLHCASAGSTAFERASTKPATQFASLPASQPATGAPLTSTSLESLQSRASCIPPACKPSPLAAKKNPACTLTNNEAAPVSLVIKKSNFAPARPPGNSSVPRPRGTKGCALGGSSMQKEKKQNSRGFPYSSIIRGIGELYPGSFPQRRSNLVARHVE